MRHTPVTIHLVLFSPGSIRFECNLQKIINFLKLHKKSKLLNYRKRYRINKVPNLQHRLYVSILHKIGLFLVHCISKSQGPIKHILLHRCMCTVCIHNLFSCYSLQTLVLFVVLTTVHKIKLREEHNFRNKN